MVENGYNGLRSINSLNRNKGRLPRRNLINITNLVAEHSFSYHGEDYFIDSYGIPRKGRLRIKRENIKKDGESGYERFATSNPNLLAKKDWSKNFRAKKFEDYITLQRQSCEKRGNGSYYTSDLTIVKYEKE